MTLNSNDFQDEPPSSVLELLIRVIADDSSESLPVESFTLYFFSKTSDNYYYTCSNSGILQLTDYEISLDGKINSGQFEI